MCVTKNGLALIHPGHWFLFHSQAAATEFVRVIGGLVILGAMDRWRRRSLLNSNCESGNCGLRQRCIPRQLNSASGASKTGRLRHEWLLRAWRPTIDPTLSDAA